MQQSPNTPRVCTMPRVSCCPVARTQAVLDVQEPQAGISKLLSSVRSPSLQQQLQADLNQAVQLFSSTLQLDHLHAKLEVITKQSCPKWHADFVQMRMLCTYAGPGTWCIENRYGGTEQYSCLTSNCQDAWQRLCQLPRLKDACVWLDVCFFEPYASAPMVVRS